MPISVDEVQGRIAAVLDQDQNTANISSADYSLRLSYLNMAQREWAESADWDVLYREYNTRTSTSTGNASVAMLGDFRKLASFPKITYDGSTTELFEEIRPQEKGQKADTDRYVMMLANASQGTFTMFVNAGTLASGASIMAPYYTSPASLASPVDVSRIPNPEYLVQRTLAYVWESRGDERFPQAKLEADKILQRMLEFESTKGEGFYNVVKTQEETRYDFRWGRDG